MKKSKFTEAQIVFALQQAEGGVTVAEVCRKRSYVLQLEAEIQRAGSSGAASAAAIGRRERPVEMDRDGPDAGQTDAAGRA
jgi:hypothetical protein